MTTIARILSLAFLALAIAIGCVALVPLVLACVLDPTDRADSRETNVR